MKHVKMLGLAVLAATASAAFWGASMASATVLCTEEKSPCPTEKKLSEKIDRFITATQSGSGVLEETGSSGTLVTCTGSEVRAAVSKPGGPTETTVLNITSLTWSGCSGTVDTVAVGTLEVHRIAGTSNGTLTSSGTEVTAVFLGVSCLYRGADLGTLTGGSPATMDINAEVERSGGSFLCPTQARLTASYNITEPKPLYVESE